MTDDNPRRERPALNDLHPYVYAGIAALAIWFVLAVWWSFAVDGYTDFLLFVISGFILTFVSFALVLSRVSRGDDVDAEGARASRRSFRGWAAREFDTWQYRLKARKRRRRSAAADRRHRVRHDGDWYRGARGEPRRDLTSDCVQCNAGESRLATVAATPPLRRCARRPTRGTRRPCARDCRRSR